MQKTFALWSLILLLTSCGVTYKTQSEGKENQSFIIVVKENKSSFKNVDITLSVDGNNYTMGKIETSARYQQAKPFIVEPGKRHVIVKVNGNIHYDELIFLGLQETRKIVLR